MWRWKEKKDNINPCLVAGHLVGNAITEHSKINIGS
jgi:hypothetical protein